MSQPATGPCPIAPGDVRTSPVERAGRISQASEGNSGESENATIRVSLAK